MAHVVIPFVGTAKQKRLHTLSAVIMTQKEKIKVAILIGQLGLGGGEKQLYRFLKDADKKKFAFVVISFNPGANDYWEKYIAEEQIPVLYVPRKSNRIVRIFNAFKLVRSLKPDIVHSWDVFANPIASLSNLLTSAVGIGGVRCNIYRPGRSSIDRVIATYGIKYFITNSTQGKEHLVKLGKKAAHVAIAFNAVDIPQESVNRTERRALLGLAQEDILIVHVGSIKPIKDQRFLLEAVMPLMEDPRLHVMFIGEGSDRMKHIGYVEKMGLQDRIKFPGQLPEAVSYMMASDIYCLTSVTEGMSNALCEAMACGLPVLSTPVGGVADLIEDGENGFVIPHGNVQVFRNRIHTLANDKNLRDSFGQKAKTTIAKKFTGEAFVNNVSEAYERFIR